MDNKKRVVVLGGGNGTSRLLNALLPLLLAGDIASLHALVEMADDGGSTGRLRRQYGVAAIGDLTKCLLALSKLRGDIRGDAFLAALEYRFSGGDFEGHTLRNMFLTALEKTSDIDSAIAIMARVLQVPKYAGVVPTTLTTLTEQVEITHEGKHSILGEEQHFISHHVNLQADEAWKPGDVRVTFKEKDVSLNPRALKILKQATHIIIAPGHTYGTILPTLALPALGKAVEASSAELWIMMTLLTTPHHTEHWTGEDFVRVYESYLGNKKVDRVITNTGVSDVQLVPGQALVQFADSEHPYKLYSENLLSAEKPTIQNGDTVPRAIVVHDSAKLTSLFGGILRE